jgi:hypothetical protein
MADKSLQLTGRSRLITLKLSRQALICVTVLLYIYILISYAEIGSSDKASPVHESGVHRAESTCQE